MAQATATRTVDGATVPAAGSYVIDGSHSAVEFAVRHLGLAKVRGRFNEFEGTVEIAEDITRSTATAVIQADTIDTRNADRDNHLRSKDFFGAEEHPTLRFETSGVRAEGGRWLLDGQLTIAGTTRPVTLHTEFEGTERDPWGNTRIAFSARTTINREDFGITWNQALESGGWLVGKDVQIELSISAVQQAAEPTS